MQRVTLASFAPDRNNRTTMANGGEDLGIKIPKILSTENVRLAAFCPLRNSCPGTQVLRAHRLVGVQGYKLSILGPSILVAHKFK